MQAGWKSRKIFFFQGRGEGSSQKMVLLRHSKTILESRYKKRWKEPSSDEKRCTSFAGEGR